VAAEVIVDQAADERAGRHAEAAGHRRAADDRAHHPQREILTDDDRIEWHGAGIDEADHYRHGVEAVEMADEGISEHAEGLRQKPDDQHALRAEAVAGKAETEAAEH